MYFLIFIINLLKIQQIFADNHVLGCGGFIKSPEVPIDLSNVEIKLSTKYGILKDKTSCAPKNGYYFLPVYDNGEYVLEVDPPNGWSFTPKKFEVSIDGKTDICSKGIDINFIFEGFGINGRVESFGHASSGPSDVIVELKGNNKVLKTKTTTDGLFTFKPVYPGEYSLQAKDDELKFEQNLVNVKIVQSTVELPKGSLVVYGYKVSGFVKSYNEPLTDVIVKLYKHPENKYVNNVKYCNREFPKQCKKTDDALCFTKTDKNGMFTFESVSHGKYYLEPYCENQYIDYKPKRIEFEVNNNVVNLKDNFEVVGLIVYGKVLTDAKDGVGLLGAEIYLNDELLATTDSDGQFKLGELKTGTYKLKIKKKNYHFEERDLKINPNVHFLPNIYPDSFVICGQVESNEKQLIQITGKSNKINIKTEVNNGQFCETLPKGTYQALILESNQNKIRFYPMKQNFEVTGPNEKAMVFSQLQATLTGKIECLNEKDCMDIKVILTSIDYPDKTILQTVQEKNYKFAKLSPGTYNIKLSQNKLCWKETEQRIIVNDITVSAPPFVQNGYSVLFVSSHDTKVSYKAPGENIQRHLHIGKGKNSYCLPKHGSYIFDHTGCHKYASKSLMYNTQVEPNEVHLSASMHSNKICISAKKDFGSVSLIIETEASTETMGPLSYKDGCYSLEINLKPKQEATLTPKSEIFYFEPEVAKVQGANDCADLGTIFKAYKGHSFKGLLSPRLKGVEITLQIDGKELTTQSDENGKYEFPPVNLESDNYRIIAKKDSYHFTGPDDNGLITAHKLAEVIVNVLDGSDKTPLQGALVSLSGSESYRSNLQTDNQGKISFKSLSSSEYYLRPMMKEYSFDPPSKILNVKEGQSLEVTLIGKRVAFSVFGTVTSLNGHPQSGVIVQARGVNNCSSYSEESLTDIKGLFRVRGLQPHCSYRLSIKFSDVEEKSKRCIPKYIELNDVNEDIKDVNILTYILPEQMKTTVRVLSAQSEYYKNLVLKVFQKQLPSSPVYSIKIGGSNIKIADKYNKGLILYLPPLPSDGKNYILQLEPITTIQNVKWIAPSVSIVANSSFKYVELDFIIQENRTANYVNQMSPWTLVSITISLVIIYNIKQIFNMIEFNFDLNLSSFSNVFKSKASTVPNQKNNADIDEIVQNINSIKKKPKAKKI